MLSRWYCVSNEEHFWFITGIPFAHTWNGQNSKNTMHKILTQFCVSLTVCLIFNDVFYYELNFLFTEFNGEQKIYC